MSRGGDVDRAGFRCAGCDAWHDEVPLAFHTSAPDVWAVGMEGAANCALTTEICVIYGQYFFVRRLIRMPVIGHSDAFEWGVWVSLSENNFQLLLDTWDQPGRERVAPVFGWLSTELTAYREPTTNLKTMVHLAPVGLRPLIELEPTDYPAALEQRHGITWRVMAERSLRLMQDH